MKCEKCENKKFLIKKALKDGKSIHTIASSMIDGSHRWWYDGEMHCYGGGSNWCDQSDETLFDLEDAIEHIYDLEIYLIE